MNLKETISDIEANISAAAIGATSKGKEILKNSAAFVKKLVEIVIIDPIKYRN